MVMRDLVDDGPAGPERRPENAAVVAAEHHPKSPAASIEALRHLAGIVALQQPVPDRHFLDEGTPAPEEPCARD